MARRGGCGGLIPADPCPFRDRDAGAVTSPSGLRRLWPGISYVYADTNAMSASNNEAWSWDEARRIAVNIAKLKNIISSDWV